MQLAEFVSTRGTCDRKHVGSVIVKDKRVLATGYNGSIPGMPHCDDPEKYWKCSNCGYIYTEEPRTHYSNVLVCRRDLTCLGKEIVGPLHGGHLMVDGHCRRTIHSELNAIASAARSGVSIEGATLYCNTLCCWECYKVIIVSGIKEFVYKDIYGPTNFTWIQEAARAIPGFVIRQFVIPGSQE